MMMFLESGLLDRANWSVEITGPDHAGILRYALVVNGGRFHLAGLAHEDLERLADALVAVLVPTSPVCDLEVFPGEVR